MKKILGVVVVLVVLVLIVWVAGNSGDTSTENSVNSAEPIKIGAILPLTGAGSGVGELIKQGYELKVAELKEAGVNIDFFIEDFASDPKQAVSAFNSITDVRGAKLVFVTTTAGSMVLRPLAAQKNVLLWADATHPDLTKDTTNVLRHANVAPEDVKIVSEAVMKTGAKKVALVYQQDDWGVAFNKLITDIFVQKGVEMISEQVDNKSNDFRAALSKVKAAKPDGIIFAVYGGAAGIVVKQARELGYTGNLFHAVGFILTPDAQKIAGDYAKGMYYQNYPMSKQITEDYKKRFGKESSAIAYISYTDMEILMHAINETKSTDPTVLLDFIKKMGSFEGKYEKVTIQPSGDIVVPTSMQVWQ